MIISIARIVSTVNNVRYAGCLIATDVVTYRCLCVGHHCVPCKTTEPIEIYCSLAVLDPRVSHTIDVRYFLHLSLSSIILIESSTGSPVHVLMLSILAVCGLPHLGLHYHVLDGGEYWRHLADTMDRSSQRLRCGLSLYTITGATCFIFHSFWPGWPRILTIYHILMLSGPRGV